jgi:hypothetical protein
MTDPHFNYNQMVTVTHYGTAPGDVVTIVADTHAEAVRKLLETKGLKEITELKPPVIETKWC